MEEIRSLTQLDRILRREIDRLQSQAKSVAKETNLPALFFVPSVDCIDWFRARSRFYAEENVGMDDKLFDDLVPYGFHDEGTICYLIVLEPRLALTHVNGFPNFDFPSACLCFC